VSDSLLIRWRTSDQAIANAVADETVILHLGSGTYFGLDPIGARLWAAVKNGAIPASLCDELIAEYDVEQATLEQDLRALIDELAANELILPA
jgi:Coenzyme PQQ synthesis protein D (PqqD)